MFREPHLTPVGAGVVQPAVDIPVSGPPIPAAYHGNSFWQDSSADLFQDQRAMAVGDVVTVKISIKDRAQLENDSERSRDATNDLAANFAYGMSSAGYTGSVSGNLGTGVDSSSTHKGKGEIERSERIDLLVAAIVTDVLPNGNLIIAGSQEVRVNFEVRVLSVTGIVHPRDIDAGNTISYERIAEARISYGGRGRLTEVQQPAWGHQLIDNISPF
jgi:flagellar L-ring protein precursor FlgH